MYQKVKNKNVFKLFLISIPKFYKIIGLNKTINPQYLISSLVLFSYLYLKYIFTTTPTKT